MNTRIALSTLSILAALGLMGGAAFAFFSDAGSSTDNAFASGNLDMNLTDGDEGPKDNVSGTWGLASAPGDTFASDLKIKNTGSVPANHIELEFSDVVTNALTPPGDDGSTPMDSVIEITLFEWDSNGDGTTDLTIPITDLNLNGIKDLEDLKNQNVDGSVDFDNLAFGGTQSNDHVLRIQGRLSPTLAVNQHQGDSVNMTLAVTMNQNASQ